MTARLSEFSIGVEFTCADKRWRCTDVGTRVVVAISIEPVNKCMLTVDPKSSRHMQMETQLDTDTSWFNGPPYAVSEIVFDEYDIEGCELAE